MRSVVLSIKIVILYFTGVVLSIKIVILYFTGVVLSIKVSNKYQFYSLCDPTSLEHKISPLEAITLKIHH
jgi:hypothetical protein